MKSARTDVAWGCSKWMMFMINLDTPDGNGYLREVLSKGSRIIGQHLNKFNLVMVHLYKHTMTLTFNLGHTINNVIELRDTFTSPRAS